MLPVDQNLQHEAEQMLPAVSDVKAQGTTWSMLMQEGTTRVAAGQKLANMCKMGHCLAASHAICHMPAVTGVTWADSNLLQAAHFADTQDLITASTCSWTDVDENKGQRNELRPNLASEASG